MPTTVQLKSDAPQEINISNSAGISITNSSAAAIQYFIDYKSNTGNWTGWKNENLPAGAPNNTVAFTRVQIGQDNIRISVRAAVDNGANIATLVY